MYVLSLLFSFLHITSSLLASRLVRTNSCFWMQVLQSLHSPTMDELKKQMDDTLMSIAKAKKYLLGLEKTEKLREALDLGKRRILYSVL